MSGTSWFAGVLDGDDVGGSVLSAVGSRVGVTVEMCVGLSVGESVVVLGVCLQYRHVRGHG